MDFVVLIIWVLLSAWNRKFNCVIFLLFFTYLLKYSVVFSVRKWCLLCKRFNSFCYLRKKQLILGWSNFISNRNCDVSSPRWHTKEILQVYQQCQICCLNRVLSIIAFLLQLPLYSLRCLFSFIPTRIKIQNILFNTRS